MVKSFGGWPRPWGRGLGIGGVEKGRGGVAKAVGAWQGLVGVAKDVGARPRPWGRGKGRGCVVKALGA